jgi:polysaccharide biosynthesis transport protein
MGGDPPPSGNSRNMVRRLTGALWRYKWLALVIVAIGTTAGYFVSAASFTPQYAAVTTLWVETPTQNTQGPIQTAPLMDAASWAELVRSFVVLDTVVHERRLFVAPRDPADAPLFATMEVGDRVRPGEFTLQVDGSGRQFTLVDGSGVVLQRGQAGEPVGESMGFRWLPSPETFVPDRRVAFTVRRPREAAQQLAANLQVQTRERGSFLVVGLTGDEPEQLVGTVNAVAERFVAVATELKRAQSEELTGLLQEQLSHAALNLRQAESALQGFRVGTVTLPSERVIQQAPGLQATQGSVFSDFFTLKTERDQLRRDREAMAEALDRRRGASVPIAALEVIPAARESSELNTVLGELATKRAELRAMRAQATDRFGPVQRLAEEVTLLEEQAVPRIASHVMTEIASREAELDRRLTAASSELRQIPERSIEEARLERAVAISSDLYRTLSQRYETARLASVSSVPDVRLLDDARAPTQPLNHGERLQMFMMFVLGSLGIAVAAPLVLDRMDSRLRYPEQVTDELGLPILGAVPHVGNGSRRLRGGEELQRDMMNGAVEALREIRLNVAHAFGTAGPLLTTVTSPGVGDGKSFITVNLALAFADLGHRTLIIDGDIRRGQLHRMLGVVRVPGLTDFLAGSATAEDIVQSTAWDSLDLIACGTRMQAGPELLGSAAMAAMVRDLRQHYDVILIDSPPLGAGVDPFLLSTLTGNTLLVVRNGKTDREFATAKLELLDRLPVRLLGAVLNDVPQTGAYRYYSYVPGYGAENEVIEAEVEGEPRRLESV